jgi:ABC-type transport system involved in multi-copper enzyme maturation permease subunit
MILFHRPFTSLRLAFRWSNSTQTWQERIGDLVLIGCLLIAAAIIVLVPLEWWQVLVVLGLCLLPALPLCVMGWLKVFGPVLYYDMIRQARRTRFTVLLLCYVLLLVFLLAAVAIGEASWLLARTNAHDGARIAEKYFNVFMLAQFCTVVLLTPAYVAGAIAEEKERKTLEFMLATDLLNREIVLSKLGSRVANLSLIVLAGLPILSILQFLGGVDPNLVLAGFAVTAITIVGQSGVSILCSVLCKRPREAIALAYLAVILYYAVALALIIAVHTPSGLATMPLWFGDDPPVLIEAVDIYNKGNLVACLVAVNKAGAMGTLAADLPGLVGEYALFHGLIAAVCTGLAVARIRRTALAQSGGKQVKARRRIRMRKRPVIGLNPMWWKEVHCHGDRHSPWTAFVLCALLAAATFVPVGLILYYHLVPPYDRGNIWWGLAESMNVWTRIANVVAGLLTVLAVAIRASTSITTERDKQTLDTLLTTPLSTNSIFNAKWAGSLFGARLGMIWLAVIWIVALLTGGMHFVALPFVAIAWVIYAAFAVTLGLWFSTVCRSSVQASVLTILGLVGLHVGHWLIWMCGPALPIDHDTIRHMLMAHAGLTPPWVLGFLPFSWREVDGIQLSRRTDGEWLEIVAWCLGGLVMWSAATVVLYRVASLRFRKMTHRDPRANSDRILGSPVQEPADLS